MRRYASLLFVAVIGLVLASGIVWGQQPRQPRPKQCMSCKNEVPGTSKVGDTCPHCGVRWNLDFSPPDFDPQKIKQMAAEAAAKKAAGETSPPSSSKGSNFKGVQLPTTAKEPPPRYTWQKAEDGKHVLYLNSRKVGVLDPKDQTYREYAKDGKLSDPIPRASWPWEQVGKPAEKKKEPPEEKKEPANKKEQGKEEPAKAAEAVPVNAENAEKGEEAEASSPAWIPYAAGGGLVVLLLVVAAVMQANQPKQQQMLPPRDQHARDMAAHEGEER